MNLTEALDKYIISPVTVYDSDDLLWYTKIGENKGEKALFCTVAGKTFSESRLRAEKLINLLKNN